MTDLADLGLRIRSEDVGTANQRLDQLAAKASTAEKATDRLGASSQRASTATGRYEQQLLRAVAEMQRVTVAIERNTAAMGRMEVEYRQVSAAATQAAAAQARYAVATEAVGARSVVAGAATGLLSRGLGGIAKVAVGTIAGFTGIGAAMSAAAIATEFLVKKLTEQKTRTAELVEETRAFTAELDKIAPSMNAQALSSDLAAEGLKNFTAWLNNTADAALRTAEAIKTATVSALMLKANQQSIRADELRSMNTRQTARGPTYKGLDGSTGLRRYEAQQAEADAAALRAAEVARKAMGASLEVFTGATNKATAATGRHTAATGRATAATRAHAAAANDDIKIIDDQAKAFEQARDASQRYAESLNDQIRALSLTQSQRTALEVRKQVGDAPTAELKEQIAMAGDWLVLLQQIREAQDGVKSPAELLGDAEKTVQEANGRGAFDRFREKIDAAADAAWEIRDAVDQAYYSIKDNDWLGAFSGLLRGIQTVMDAWKKAANAKDKASAVAMGVDMVGQAVGGKAGNALSGAAQGFQMGMMTGNPLIAAGAAIVGGVMGVINGDKQKKEQKLAQERADMERAAQIAADRANQQRELELDLLRAQGKDVEALAKQREYELSALDRSNRALQEQIYKLQDWQTALDEANSKVDDARSVLTEAYARESQALQSTIDTFTQLMASLKAYGQSLAAGSAGNLSIGARYQATRGQFLAGANDNSPAGLGALQGLAEAFLPAAKAQARTSLDFAREVAMVRGVVGSAAAGAQAQVSIAEQQLSALQASVSGLIIINQSVISVQQAIINLQNALAARDLAQAAKPANDVAAAPAYQVVGPAGYVDQNADLAALYASGSGMARGRTKEEFGLYHWQRYGQAEDRYYRAFALGGYHTGGLRLVGEQGPELEATGPSRIWNAQQTSQMLGGGNAELVVEIRALRAEVAALRADAKRTADASEKGARYGEKTSNTLTRVTRDGDSLVTEAA